MHVVCQIPCKYTLYIMIVSLKEPYKKNIYYN